MPIISVTLAFIVFLVAGPAHAQPVDLPRLSVDGNRIVDDTGSPVALRGVSLCSLSWHEPLTLLGDASDPVRGWKGNIVRLPVQPQEWERLGPQDYIRDRLDPAVAICRRNGVYCIVDWHEIGDWNTNDTAKRLEDFWHTVAPRYANQPHILYELFNEPIAPKERTYENWIAFRDTAQKWIDQVRAAAPETVLLVGSPHWSQMPSFAVEAPFAGDNLVYVAHIYGGWKPETWDGLFGEASEKIPVFMSEWGWSSRIRNRTSPFYGTQKDYGEPMRAYLDDRPHIGWTAWSYDPQCGPAMLGNDSEMGTFVREWLGETDRADAGQ
ncbi:MAG: glycoside hydrolase family 5 protein [Alphaproteobacteria bacterium]|nr:glycoside hydrolase family 5 protein [Alphaproteobacteria bacterium]